MSNSLLLEEVESFLRKERGLSKSKVITTATTLEDDLGITGIEGEMFMEAFFAHFKVDEGDFCVGTLLHGRGVRPSAHARPSPVAKTAEGARSHAS